VAIDQSKAFDKIDHDFMTLSYKFFGFGDNFINMMDTVGQNRRACIILDDGALSNYFSLDTGRPQGEILSPDQYNIGQQICLFKIELCPEIASIFNHFLRPRFAFEIGCNKLDSNKYFINESEGETSKAECFADDNNIITLRESKSIDTLFEILQKFGDLSGLYCNFKKKKTFLI